MRLSNFSHSILAPWVMALGIPALVMAPFGCETLSLLQIASSDEGQFGWFVNPDKTGDLLLGARAPSQACLFAYGSFKENGDIDRITGVVLRDAEGNESFISLDDKGWPVHLEIADGSYAHLEYSEQTDTHVAGQLRLYNAQEQTEEIHSFDVDLDQALATLADEIEQLAGQQLEVLPDPNARPLTNGAKSGPAAATVVYPLFVLPFVAMAYLVSYVAAAIFNAVALVVTEVVRVTLIAVFAPLFLLAEVTNAVLFLPLRTTSLVTVFGVLPPTPRWALI